MPNETQTYTTGTAAMIVGFITLKSPFWPFLMAVAVSEMVCGEE